MYAKILQDYSKEFIYLIIYINNKYRQQFTLFFLLLPVTCYRHVFRDCPHVIFVLAKKNTRTIISPSAFVLLFLAKFLNLLLEAFDVTCVTAVKRLHISILVEEEI